MRDEDMQQKANDERCEAKRIDAILLIDAVRGALEKRGR